MVTASLMLEVCWTLLQALHLIWQLNTESAHHSSSVCTTNMKIPSGSHQLNTLLIMDLKASNRSLIIMFIVNTVCYTESEVSFITLTAVTDGLLLSKGTCEQVLPGLSAEEPWESGGEGSIL